MRSFLAILVLLACALAARAERYLTIAEAQKLCFPTGDRFVENVLKFSKEDLAAIQKKVGGRVPNDGNRIFYAYSGNNLLGVMFIDHVLGKHEIIDYAVAVTPDGKVRQVEILEYRESYGFEIRTPKWRRQFVGKSSGSPLRLNGDIYNISGATMSCRHVTQGIKRVLATFDLLCRPQLAAGGLSHAATDNR
jgi:Na+-translocating ferredoxin:NAD+ oxidoreductase RnfG subunit